MEGHKQGYEVGHGGSVRWFGRDWSVMIRTAFFFPSIKNVVTRTWSGLIFKRMFGKDVVTWNLMVSGYVQHGLIGAAVDTCMRMRLENLRYDSVTLVSILSSSAKKKDLKLGKESHCFCIRNDSESDPVVASNIVDVFSGCDKIGSARQVFENAAQIDLVMWNNLISPHTERDPSVVASKSFHRMQLRKVELNVVSWNSLMHGFLNNGEVDEACESFSQMEHHGILPNHLTWTTLISGLGNNGFYDEAIKTFVRMQDSGIKPNVVSIIAALLACGGSVSLRYGRTIHGYILRFDLNEIPEIATSILDMLTKAGRAEEARKYFHTITKNLSVYNVMISCNAVHGRACEALKLCKGLRKDGFQPDCTTFTSILSACSHSGFVDEAMVIFNEMTCEYRVQSSIEHYGCAVRLLCWCEHLEEALRIVLCMPHSPDVYILGSLITACTERGEVELAEALSEQMIGIQAIPGTSWRSQMCTRR